MIVQQEIESNSTSQHKTNSKFYPNAKTIAFVLNTILLLKTKILCSKISTNEIHWLYLTFGKCIKYNYEKNSNGGPQIPV